MEENKTAQDSIDALKSSGADSSVLTLGVLQGYQGTGGSDARNGMSLFWRSEGLPLSKAAKDGGTHAKTQRLILLGRSDQK